MGFGMRSIFFGGINQNECVALCTRFATVTAPEEQVNLWDNSTPINLCISSSYSWLAISIHISNKLHQKGI
jgi:hypothetical protein